MKTKKTYTSLSIYGDKLVADYTSAADKLTKLDAGVYTIHYDPQSGMFWFKTFNPISDNILDLPSPEYTQVTREMQHFLKPETRTKFHEMGFIYKRSALLHGLPGTGKTCIVNRISRDVVNAGGIVIYNDNPNLLRMAFDVLSDLQPETLTLAVFEEFDSIAKRFESQLLTLLDGEVQKENIMYLATTNYLDKIPKRLYRPGRFSSVIEVDYPTLDARKMYLEHKLGANNPNIVGYVEKTQGLSIDELKEVVQSVEILKNDLQETLDRLKNTRDFSANSNDSRTGVMKLLMPEPHYSHDNDDYDSGYSQDEN